MSNLLQPLRSGSLASRIHALLVIGIACCTGCSSLHPVADDLDPVPAWYNQEFREIVSGQYVEIAEEIRLLCWQESRARYVGEEKEYTLYVAFLWVRLCRKGKTTWSTAFLRGSPGYGWDIPWASHSDDPIQFYPAPPTNDQIDALDTWERVVDNPYIMKRTITAGGLRARTWEAVTGEKPTRPFATSGSN